MPTFHEFAEVCQALSQTSSRLQMAALVGEFLAGLEVREAEIAARFFIGRALGQGETVKLNVSGRAIWLVAAEIAGAVDRGEEIFAGAVDFGEAVEIVMRARSAEPQPTLTIAEVGDKLTEIASIEGARSRRRKLDALRELLGRATSLEAKYIAKILIREMRHGVSEGMMIDAIAKMANRPATEIRRMLMLEGDLGRVVAALRGGPLPPPATPPALRFKPLKPMLAFTAQDVPHAFEIMGPELALEHKLDGARVQIHKVGAEVKIFSRRLNEITASLPEVVELMTSRLGDRNVILDGEVIATNREGHPIAFQELMRRFRRIREVERLRVEQPIQLFLFDILADRGELVIEQPYADRFVTLSALAREADLELIGRMTPGTIADGEKFFEDAIAAGHEGLMAKALASPYTPGSRGRGWLKIKRAKTLDLVIVAADWGYGRRHGWLSNYHLAARDEHSGKFLEVGKTFKGLSDEQFREMTERLRALKTEESRGTVAVRPEVVVEVGYSDIQRSPQYEVGMALRFARILRIRDDKGPSDADTVAALTAEFDRQLVRPSAKAPV